MESIATLIGWIMISLVVVFLVINIAMVVVGLCNVVLFQIWYVCTDLKIARQRKMPISRKMLLEYGVNNLYEILTNSYFVLTNTRDVSIRITLGDNQSRVLRGIW